MASILGTTIFNTIGDLVSGAIEGKPIGEILSKTFSDPTTFIPGTRIAKDVIGAIVPKGKGRSRRAKG